MLEESDSLVTEKSDAAKRGSRCRAKRTGRQGRGRGAALTLLERKLPQGEPCAGERPDRSLGRSTSAAGTRSKVVATDRRSILIEIREADRSRASDSPMPGKHKDL
jgi:hypothetical protein